MLDMKLIREQTAYVKAQLGRAGVQEAEIDQVLECDAQRRRLQHELDELRARRTRESKELGKLTVEEREARRAEMRSLGDRIAGGEHELAAIEKRLGELMLGIRNLPREYVQSGAGEADNLIIKTEGEPSRFDFQPLPHWELGEKL